MYRPLRKQGGAPPRLLPQVPGWPAGSVVYPNPWERACSRRLSIWQLDVLNVPAPSQASLLPQVPGWPAGCGVPKSVGASLLAKAFYLAIRCAECTGLFASKLAPTGSGLARRFCGVPKSVGASLLAKAFYLAIRCVEWTGPFASKLAPTSPVLKHPLKTPDLSILQLALD